MPHPYGKPTRQSPLPLAYNEYELSPTRWSEAERAGQAASNEFKIKHTEKIRSYTEQIMARLEAELRQWRNLPREVDMRERLSEVASAFGVIDRV